MVVSPTGSGKTVEIVACVPLLLTSSATHVVIVTPQEHVEVAFTDRVYRYIGFPGVAGLGQRLFDVRADLIQAARSIGGRESVEDYLRQPGPMVHALCTTHAAWRGVKLPDIDLSGYVLFVDEAHRAPAECFAEQGEKWSKQGGLVRYFTATDYRGDEQTVLLPGMARLHRSLAVHMDEGWAPHHFRSSLMPLGRRGDSISRKQLSGEASPRRPDELASAMVKQWLTEQRPKTVVRVPPMRGGSQDMVQLVVKKFEGAGARVVDGSGVSVGQKKKLIAALHADNGRCYACSEIDVIVGIQRVAEGLDWLHCAAVYSYGIPGSPTLYNQLAGRSLRKKADDHPHKDDAWINFFVDTAGGRVLDSMSRSHSRETLLMCCYSVDTNVGLRWAFLKAARQGVQMSGGSQPIAGEEEPEFSGTRAATLLTATAYLSYKSSEPASLKSVTMFLRDSGIPPREAQVAILELLCVDEKVGPMVRARVAEATARATRNGRAPLSDLRWLFDEVLEDFRDVTLEQNPAVQQLGAQMHKLTGRDMMVFAQQLLARLPEPTGSDDADVDKSDPPYVFDDLCRMWDETLPELSDEGVFAEDGTFVAPVQVSDVEIRAMYGTGYSALDDAAAAAFVDVERLDALSRDRRVWITATKGECSLAWNLAIARTKREVIATLLRQQVHDVQMRSTVREVLWHALKSAPEESERYVEYHHRARTGFDYGRVRTWEPERCAPAIVLAAAGCEMDPNSNRDDCARTIRHIMVLMKWVFYQAVRGPSRLVVVVDYEERMQARAKALQEQLAAERQPTMDELRETFKDIERSAS